MNYGDMVEQQVAEATSHRQGLRRYLANRAARNALMERIALGEKVTDLALYIGVPYAVLYSVLTNDHKEQYQAARNAFAETLAEKNLAMADRVENLQLPADVAKTAAGIRQWHMERTASEQWGQKSSVNLNVKGVVGLHLEAIRQLSKEPLEGEFEEVADEHDGKLAGGWDDHDGPGSGGDLPGSVVGQHEKLKGEHLL